MKALFAQAKDWCVQFCANFRSGVRNVILATVVPVGIIVLDLIGTTIGSPVLISALLSGVILIASLFFILMGMPIRLRGKVVRILGQGSWIIDAVITIVLTIYGFKLGVMMGLVAMSLGLHLSLLLGVIRLVQIIFDPAARVQFLGEQAVVSAQPRPKRMKKFIDCTNIPVVA